MTERNAQNRQISPFDSRQPTADSRQPTADSRQPTADSRQPTADSRQPTAPLYCKHDKIRVNYTLVYSPKINHYFYSHSIGKTLDFRLCMNTGFLFISTHKE
jgi:hypothetical protein